MTLVTLNFSDSEISLVRQQAEQLGFPAIEDYLQDLVKEQLQTGSQPDRLQQTAPELVESHKDQMEARVSEAMSGSGRLMTREDFAQLRRELVARYGSGRGE